MNDIEMHLPLTQLAFESSLIQQVLDNYRNKVRE